MRTISEAFSRLEPAKQEQIRKAALREFARHGYEQASTNTIVKEAGIAKGTLFYYFKSKQELFDYLVEHILKYVETEYLARLDFDEPDFLERYSQVARVKMESYIKDKEAFEFLGSLYLRRETEKLWLRLDQMYHASMENMVANIDTSLFRSDITPEQAIKLTTWATEGYQNELIARLQDKDLSTLDMKPYWDEFYAFLEVMRKVLYRQEEV